MAEGVIERAAQAAREAENVRLGGILPPWEQSTDETREAWRGIARAVLDAIREPSDAMLDAACRADGLPRPNPAALIYWQAMIDAALGESDG